MVVVLAALAFIGVAIAKPWGTFPTGQPSAHAARSVPATLAPAALATPQQAPVTPALPPVDFTLPAPLPASAPWSGIQWQRPAPGPLHLVRTVLRWPGGFIALGDPGLAETPVWTSQDGARWEFLASNTAATFWPGMAVVGIAQSSTGLVALTELLPTDCAPTSCSSPAPPFIIPWTSSDGRSWTAHDAVFAGSAISTGPEQVLLASGPAGLVAATGGSGPVGATSSDGITWRSLPRTAFPRDFELIDLRGTATGYVAGGRWAVTGSHSDAATLWSGDGLSWIATHPLPVAAAGGVSSVSIPTGAVVTLIIPGRDGMMATGWDAGREAILWWQSSDGRTWRQLTTYSPLGPTACPGEGCGRQPDGVIVGDGTRIVAARGDPNAGIWSSFDGLAWQPIPLTGDLPTGTATQAVLLPGGLLLANGTANWWYGEATVH